MRIKNTGKTFSRTIVSTLAAAILTVGLAGCTSDAPFKKDPSSNPSASTSESAEPTEETSVAPTEETSVEPTSVPTDEAVTDEPQILDYEAQAANLEAYAQAERDSVASIYDLYPGVYLDVVVLTQPTGSLEFEYTYAETVDKAAAETYFAGIQDQLESQSMQTVFPAMRSFDLRGPLNVTYRYLNPDASLLWEWTYYSD